MWAKATELNLWMRTNRRWKAITRTSSDTWEVRLPKSPIIIISIIINKHTEIYYRQHVTSRAASSHQVWRSIDLCPGHR